MMTRFAILSATVLMVAQAASASVLHVENNGFESPNLAAFYVANPGEYAHIARGIVSGWTSNSDNTYGIDAANFGFASGVEGLNVAFLEPGADGATTQIVYEILNDTVQAGTYTLTVGAGHSSTYNAGIAADAKIGFNSYNTSSTAFSELKVDTVASSLMPTGSLSDSSVTLNVSADNPHLGEKLVVILAAIAPASGVTNVSFDNVRVDFTAVPEPSAMLLGTLGAFGLLAYAWRRR